MITLYVHLEGLETALLEVEALPTPTDTCIVGRNPRRRDGKDLPYLLSDVSTIILPMTRVTFIEVLTDEAEDDFETFIRE